MSAFLKTLRHAIHLLRSGRLLRSGIPWLRRHGFPMPASLEAYRFHRYRRARQKQLPAASLSGVRAAGEDGLVSIVLPVYNGERYLGEALDSVLAQSYTQWELIAVDDGSTDASPGILDAYAAANPRIRVIHQPNQKLPAALNNGFGQARGEYFTWISDDNRLYPQFLARLVDCLQRRPDWDLVYANEDIIGADGEPLREGDWFRGFQSPLGSEHIHLPADPFELNTVDDNYLGAAFLYRARAAALLGEYSPHRYTAEDYDYWMRANALLTLRHADFSEPLLAYRFHGRSLTSQKAELGIARARARLQVWDDFRRDFYLFPLHWRIESDGSPEANSLAAELRRLATEHGHFLEIPALRDLPRLWLPRAMLYITRELARPALPDGGAPPGTLSALVAVGGGVLPSVVDSPFGFHAALSTSALLPAGWLAAPNTETLFTILDIRTRSQYLAEIEAYTAAPPTPGCRLSVIICTQRRGERLETAVVSVGRQTYPSQDFELIIVNNAPDDTAIVERAARLGERYFAPGQLRLVQCPVAGLSAARNAGLAEAGGEIVCYLDDDAIAEPNWLAEISKAFDAHPEAGVVGGSILLKKPEPLPRWWRDGMEVHWSHFAPDYPGCTAVTHWSQYPWGANWCARREALLAMGGFRTRYGRKPGTLMSGEEVTAAALIQRLGWAVGVAPQARVTHDVLPERFTLRHVRGILLGGRQSWYRAQMDGYTPWELGPGWSLRRIGKALWPPTLRALLRGAYMLFTEARTLGWQFADWVRRWHL